MDDILRKAQRLAKKGEFHKAGNLLEIADDLENAAKMYLKAGSIVQAAKLYETLRFFHKSAELYARSEQFLKAAELFKIEHNYSKSAEMFQRAGQHFNAAEMFKKDKKYLQAAKNYDEASQHEAAGDMYAKSSNHLKAARSYQKGYTELLQKKEDEILHREKEISLRRIAEKGAEAYLSAKREEEAAYFFEKAGNWNRAGILFEKLNVYDKAIEMFFQTGDFKNGLRLINKCNPDNLNLHKYARILNEEGHPYESATLYEKAHKYEDAGYQYQLAHHFTRAAVNFKKAECYSIAAECYIEDELYPEAAEMYEKAGRFRNAAEIFLRADMVEEALEQFILAGDELVAAELAEKLNQRERAEELLLSIDNQSSDYIEATFRLGKIYFEKNELDKALKYFQIAAHEDQSNPNRTETFYFLGRVWEEKNFIENADECYNQVLKYDSEFRDTNQRLEGLEDLKRKAETKKIRITKSGDERKPQTEDEALTSFLRRRYEIEKILGEGILGKVYKAKDTLLDRPVTLKEIEKKYFASNLVVTRFKRKIMSSARLNHPNIVTIFDMGEDDNFFLIAREYIEGYNLKHLLQKGRLPLHKVISIVSQCLWALDYAHNNKVIHRNLSPENILLTPENTVKISDFGLFFRESELTDELKEKVSKRNIYVSLDTIHGEPESPRDDLISIGQIMNHMLTGTLNQPPEVQELNPEWESNEQVPERFKKVLHLLYTQDEGNLIKANEFVEMLKSDTLGPGSLFDGRYEIISKMGKGGMGAVFKAHDRVLKELVAIKALRESALLDERNLQRFKWEIKAARKISHPNVVRIHHLGYCEGTYYISMELIYGITLKEQILDGKELPLCEKVDIILQIVDALSAVHALEIIHRDVKPQNILLDKDLKVKIVDFGIARVGNLQGLTDTGEVMGTPEYMAPEQIRKKLDVRSDIYSLGIVAYEFLSGKLPFAGDTPISVLMAHLKKKPPRIRKFQPLLDEELERIVLKCLEKSPEARYQTMDELSKDLKQYRKSLEKNKRK